MYSCLHADPKITTSSVAAPIVGSMYSLICAVAGTERLTDAMVTYTWSKNGAVVSNQKMATLSFSPLTLSDAGEFICEATVSSSLLNVSISDSSVNINIVSIRLIMTMTHFYLTCDSYINCLGQ